jgi:O-antigen ligase
MSAVTFLAIGFSLQDTVIQRIEKNRQDSSGDLAEHVQSISNMKTDASNLERLNRWDCAFRMFAESPVFGKGPGTYSFLYAPYQRSANLTVISTNFGDLGNAHSEYFGPLAEQGVLGLVSLLAIIFFAYYRGIPLYYRMKDREHARLFMGILMGHTTYFIHGLLNNYLDQDKAAIAFWGFLAVITAFDIYEEKQDLEAKSSLK